MKVKKTKPKANGTTRLFYILSFGALIQGMLLMKCGRSLKVQDVVDLSSLSTFLENDWKEPVRTITGISAEPQIAIFYNIYTAPGKSRHTLNIVNEQLEIWRGSGIAKMATLYYALLGEEIAVPCNTDETCKRLKNINTSGHEEETLQRLHAYCSARPQDKVLYLHSKGSFHDTNENKMMRGLATNAIFSDACTTIREDECDVCSARFTPLPHWHTSGNMWVAQCSHVRRLISPKGFQASMDQVTGEATKVFPHWGSGADWLVGSKRYANEHWVHTHPAVKPCDVYAGNWTWDYTVDLKTDGPFERASAPRFAREEYKLMDHPGHWMNIGYRILEMYILYKEVPPRNSWVWDFYLKGGKIKRGLPGLRQWNMSVWESVPHLSDLEENPYIQHDDSDSDSSFTVPDLSIIVLTFNNSARLGVLLDSIVRQKTKVPYELIIADNGCRAETRNIADTKLQHHLPFQFLRQCDNPGYSVGNNRAVNATSDSSSWILFLNDDMELMDGFIQHMYDLGQAKQNAGAVGCKLVSADGSKLLEAGSLIWNDASCHGYGRDSTDPDAPEFSFTRPTDYVSGACLMAAKG